MGTHALALDLLGADTSGDIGQGIGFLDQLERLLELAFTHQVDHFRDMDLDRAAAFVFAAVHFRQAEFTGPVIALLVT